MSAPRVFIIAEAGVNHNGRLDLAMKLAEAARAAGADAVKYQTFRAADVVTRGAATAAYQRANTGAERQFDMIAGLELAEHEHEALARHCQGIGIEYCSTPFSEDAVAMLVRLGVRRIKLASGEITNQPLLRCAASTRLPLILSSGMSTLEETGAAVAVIRQCWQTLGFSPPRDHLSILHCTSAYPAPAASLNLRALTTLASAFGLPVGYSDHSLGSEAAVAAVALGATILEKHLTLDKALPGPDHLASANPAEFASLVKSVRRVESMLGNGVKVPHAIEEDTRLAARRSIVVVRDLRRGHVLSASDLALRRPGTGLSPASLPGVLGRRLALDVTADTVLAESMLSAEH